MKPEHGAVFVRINQYARDGYNLLVNQARSALSDSPLDMSLAGSAWRVGIKSRAVGLIQMPMILKSRSGVNPAHSRQRVSQWTWNFLMGRHPTMF